MLGIAHGQSTPSVYVQAALTSQDLLPGEQASVIVRVSGGQPDQRPPTPEIDGVGVNYVRTQTQIDSQRRLSYAFLFRLSPVKAGSYTLPAIPITVDGKVHRTDPVDFTVHPVDKLISLPTGVAGQEIKAAWFTQKSTLYQGEQCQVWLRIYVPRSMFIASWGYPDAEKVNCLAWRFSPPGDNVTSEVQLDGVQHRSVTYSTNISGIRPGIATLGPAELTIYQRRSIIDPRRGSVISDVPIKLNLPQLNFNILPLPAGAPADFNGAIGDFEIDARCEKTTLEATEPTEVILRVAGIGNLETLKAPVLSSDAWKIIDTSKITRGEERREISGLVTFRQLIRAKDVASPPSTIAPYTFSYFNPDSKTYITRRTDPIAVTLSPATAAVTSSPTEEAGTAPEEMRGIVGFIDRPNTAAPSGIMHSFARWGWQLIPALLCLLIVAPAIRRKISAARVQHPDQERKDAALKKIAQDADARTFYRRAGRFIEQWLSPNPELETVLRERDQLCFQPETEEKSPMPADRKAEIISLLKRCSKLTLILLISLATLGDLKAEVPPNTGAGSQPTAEAAWKTGHYKQAIDLYRAAYPEPSNTPADVLYNIGNCHHRLNQPGRAALAWRQALRADPSHQKARQNLRFTEIENLAEVPETASWQKLLTYLTPRSYQLILQASLWLIGLLVLALIIRRPKGAVLTVCIILLAITPVIATLGAVATHYYPDGHTFAPLEQQAIVLESATVHDQAHRSSTQISQLAPASLVKVNASRGPWTHITTPTETTGWVESKFLGKVTE
ncbi:BatD family protein [Verrucomicrobiaceae bacterium R5-34]|nr:BatD family protein [Verrucomicrobiaceae bacterium R5-34]